MPSNVKQMHERDLIGLNVVDFDERVDVKRLRRERIQRLQAELAKTDLGAALFFDPVNIRYATGTRLNETFGLRHKGSYVIVPREGKPILFGANELQGPVIEDEVVGVPATSIEFWFAGGHTWDVTRKWAKSVKDTLAGMGAAGQPLGIDRLDGITIQALWDEGIKIGDAVEPLAMSRAVKTRDEIALIRQACAIADVALCKVRDAIKPGVTENELFSIMLSENLNRGGERIDGKLLTAGGNTNPWLKRDASDRMVRHGDLVAMDTDMAGPLGYFADISRTYLCDDGKPNEEQMDAHKRAYDYVHSTIPYFKVGTSFLEIAEAAPVIPPEYKANRYAILAHGAGMSDEWPAIHFADPMEHEYSNYPGEIQENMVICMEASFGREGGREQVKLEEQLLITSDGPEVISTAPYDWRFVD